MKHLMLLGKYEQKKQRREVINAKLAALQHKQRQDLDRLQGMS